MHICLFYASCENTDDIWFLIKTATAILTHKTNCLRKFEPGETVLSGPVLCTIWLPHFLFCIRSPRDGVIELSNLSPNNFLNSLTGLIVFILPSMILLRIANRLIIKVHNIYAEIWRHANTFWKWIQDSILVKMRGRNFSHSVLP